jgi:hypothetical protein
VPVGVGERQLGAGVGILTAADRPDARRPAGKVQGMQLGDLGAQAGLAVGIGGGHPSGVGDGQDGLAHALIGRQADREPDAALAQVVREAMGSAAGVGADQDRLGAGGAGQLRQGQVEDPM